MSAPRSADLISLSNSIVHLPCLLNISILSVFECTVYATLALSTYCFAITDASFSEDDGKNTNMVFYL